MLIQFLFQTLYDFFDRMDASLDIHPLWEHCSRWQLSHAKHELHEFVFLQLYPLVFPFTSLRARDTALFERIKRLHFVRPHHLDIAVVIEKESLWQTAGATLLRMGGFASPMCKLACILNACKIIICLLEEAGHPAGADEFVPQLVYLVLNFNPSNLLSNLSYISRFCDPEMMVMENVCFFTHMVFAVSFIEIMDHTHLKMAKSEFNSLFK